MAGLSVGALDREVTIECLVAQGDAWSGKWFADVDPTSGLAVIVVRDPALTAPVSLALNTDGLSSSNLTAFDLLKPQAGWTTPVTEIEYICIADRTSWPDADRTAARLPAWCGRE